MDVLIDDKGNVCPIGPGLVRQFSSGPIFKTALPDDLIRNQGYVRLGVRDASCSIRAVPQRMQYATYASLVDQLKPLMLSRISLSTLANAHWQHKVVASKEQALDLLHDQMYRGRKRDDRRYLTRPQNLNLLNSASPLAKLFCSWKATSGQLELDAQFLSETLQSKYSILEFDGISGGLKFSEIGSGLVMYRPGWGESFIGAPADLQPDIQYGRAVADEWKSVLTADEPALTDVDALIHEPTEPVVKRWRYTRLALPLRTRGEASRLLTVTLPNVDVDLRSDFQHQLE